MNGFPAQDSYQLILCNLMLIFSLGQIFLVFGFIWFFRPGFRSAFSVLCGSSRGGFSHDEQDYWLKPVLVSDGCKTIVRKYAVRMDSRGLRRSQLLDLKRKFWDICRLV